MLPEVQIQNCWWCGGALRSGSWVGVYEPVLAETVHGKPQLCWTCAHKCSALAGQPAVPYHFDARPSFCPFCEPLPAADATEDPLEGRPTKLCDYHERRKRAVDEALGVDPVG